MEFLAPLLQRNVIIALAVGGGVLALAGNLLLRRETPIRPRLARVILRSGYSLSWLSVGLFIVAGFLRV